ncbi:hypothetical protein COO60DRAFT_1542057 [Scenedesmus sp. NREL 46B-D3]|nr:hypothetical protein COO60DRAFT_1542057 [Scenedesmus sp. NREL 46B-D3]
MVWRRCDSYVWNMLRGIGLSGVLSPAAAAASAAAGVGCWCLHHLEVCCCGSGRVQASVYQLPARITPSEKSSTILKQYSCTNALITCRSAISEAQAVAYCSTERET